MAPSTGDKKNRESRRGREMKTWGDKTEEGRGQETRGEAREERKVENMKREMPRGKNIKTKAVQF